MDRQEILKTIKDILSEEFEIDKDDISPESHLFEDLELDSLDAIDLLIDMERKFGIKIDNERAKTLQTVDDVIDFIIDLRK
jgi:acyl carrier protein